MIFVLLIIWASGTWMCWRSYKNTSGFWLKNLIWSAFWPVHALLLFLLAFRKSCEN
jgi:hypothetical protein